MTDIVVRRISNDALPTLCRERAEGYGALRQSSLTAIALDQAADTIEQLRARIAEAVLAEREACAKVAECEQMLAHDGLDLTGFHGENTRCRVIAAAIRERDDAGR